MGQPQQCHHGVQRLVGSLAPCRASRPGADHRAGVLPALHRGMQAGERWCWRQAAVLVLLICEREEGGRIASFPESTPEGQADALTPRQPRSRQPRC